MAKKHMTINNLAVMVKRGFDGVDKGFEQIDKWFELIDKRLDLLDKRIMHIDAEIVHINARLDTLEHDVAEIRKYFIYRDEFEDALARIVTLERKIGLKSVK